MSPSQASETCASASSATSPCGSNIRTVPRSVKTRLSKAIVNEFRYGTHCGDAAVGTRIRHNYKSGWPRSSWIDSRSTAANTGTSNPGLCSKAETSRRCSTGCRNSFEDNYTCKTGNHNRAFVGKSRQAWADRPRSDCDAGEPRSNFFDRERRLGRLRSRRAHKPLHETFSTRVLTS